MRTRDQRQLLTSCVCLLLHPHCNTNTSRTRQSHPCPILDTMVPSTCVDAKKEGQVTAATATHVTRSTD